MKLSSPAAATTTSQNSRQRHYALQRDIALFVQRKRERRAAEELERAVRRAAIDFDGMRKSGARLRLALQTATIEHEREQAARSRPGSPTGKE